MHQLLLATLLILVLAAPALSWEPMTLGTSDTQESAATKTTNLLLAECFHRLEYRLTILIRPSKRSILEADEGNMDGDFARTEAVAALYPNLVKVPEPIGTETLSAFSADPNLTIDGWDSLAGFHVAWVDGREICNRHLGQAPHKTLEQNEVALLRFVGEKRAEVGIMGRDRGRELLKRLGIAHVRPLEPPLEEGQLYLYLHKRHEHIVPKVAAMLRSLKEDGTHDAIRRHFFEGGPYPKELLSAPQS